MTWLEVFEARRALNSPGNRLQLATVDAAGAPAVRTVVLRGFTSTGEAWFFTDARSPKVEHMLREPRVALLAWWERTEEQFRLEGLATVHGEAATGEPALLRDSSWERLGERRAPFLGPAPGSASGSASGDSGSPSNFVVVTVAVARVDWLRLGAVHLRSSFVRNGEVWVRQELVP